MPGLSQLEQFNRDILALGDELKIRTARGEKPVRVPIPKNVEDRDDSEDFADGIPQLSEDEINQAEAAAAEREREKYDFSAITGESSSASETKKTESTPAPVVLPDVSDILNTAADLNLDDTDLSEFETPEPEPEPEPEVTPIEDMDLDSLLQFSETPAEDETPEEDDFASDSDDSYSVPSEPSFSEPSNNDAFNSKLDALAENAETQPTVDFDMEEASKDFTELPDGTSQTIDLTSDLPDELSMPEEDESASSNDIDLTTVPDEGASGENVSNETVSDETVPDFGADAFGDLASFDGSSTATENADVAAAADIADATTATELPADSSLSDTGLADTGLSDTGLNDIPDFGDITSLGDLPEPDTASAEVPAGDLGLGDIPDFDAPAESTPTEMPAGDVGLGDLPDFDAPAASDAITTPETPAADAGTDLPELGDLPDLDAMGDTKEAPAASSGLDDLGLGNFDIDSLDKADSGTGSSVVDELPVEDLTSAVPEFDTSGMDMDDSDFSAPASSDFEFGNITSVEGDDFSIPGFSDTLTANLNKRKEEAVAQPVAGESDDGQAKKEKNTFTDAEYKLFLQNLEHYPLNVRIALEDFVVKNEFTDDAVFEVLEKILRKVPARQVAADLEKKLDISIPVPRDFEHRTAEEYDAYKHSIEYQLKNRIIPGVILTTFAAVIISCVWLLSKTFIYEPIRATNYYKQGYALIQKNEYPLSEQKFNDAQRYKIIKSWFFKYARSYRDHKQYERARTMYKRIVRQFNHDKTAGLEWAAMEAQDLYNYEESERIIKREVLDYHINDSDTILQLGDLYLDWATEKDPAKFELAKQQYDLLMQLYGDKKKNVSTYLARQMRYYIRTDNLGLVLQYKQNYFPVNKNLGADDLVELSGYLLNKRYGTLPLSEENLRSHIEGLRSMLEDAMKRAPNNPMAMYNMGQYFVKTNNGKKGIAFFNGAIEVFKSQQYRNRRDTYRYIDTYRLLGEEYTNEREFILAEQAYQQGIDLFEKENNSSGFESTADIGKLYADMGDLDYFISGDMDTALRNYIKAVNGKNDTPSIRYRIGFIQYRNRNYPEALGSFIRSAEGAPEDTHVLLSLANTLSLRDDNYAAQGYYEKLLNILDVQRNLYEVLLPQVREDQADIVDTYMRASNNLGVTLSRIAQLTGDSKMNAHAIVSLQESLRAWDALTRNQETMLRLEGSNLAAQNIKYLTEPYSEYEPGIYTEIPMIMNDEEGL